MDLEEENGKERERNQCDIRGEEKTKEDKE